jgi:hypothetical protein
MGRQLGSASVRELVGSPAPTVLAGRRALFISIEESPDSAVCWETALVNGDVIDFDELAGADLVMMRCPSSCVSVTRADSGSRAVG